MRPTAQLRSLYLQATKVEHISIRSIISTLGDNSFALLLILFALLSIALTPVPGQAMILSVPMTLICIQWCQGRRVVTLPARWAAGTIKSAHFQTGLKRMLPALVWLEKYCRRRAPDLLTPSIRQMAHVVLLLLSAALFIPIPLSHLMPDIAIIVIALGELEDDGYMLMGGIVLGILNICAFIVLMMLLLGGLI